MDFNDFNAPTEKITTSWSDSAGIELFIKREDLIHPLVSGNKFRKLKYNLLEAKDKGYKQVLSFGGAFSNHIHALSAAGSLMGFKTIGIIRGEKQEILNPTLKFASENGMQLEWISRELYRDKHLPEFLATIKEKFPRTYIIPEGGTNELAIKGCEEILQDISFNPDYICTAVGTGGTIAGLINSSLSNQKVLGFSALKGEWIKDEVKKLVSNAYSNWEVFTDYHFGGYAKMTSELIQFIDEFHSETNIQLEPIYTGKMFYGIKKMCESHLFIPNSRILTLHTGGLQGLGGLHNKIVKLRQHIVL